MRVADMSVEEFKVLVQETVVQAMAELLNDPDEGLALRDDFEIILRNSLEKLKADPSGQMFSAEEVATELGLEW